MISLFAGDEKMLASQAKRISSFCISNGVISEQDREKYDYCYEILLSSVLNIFSVVTLISWLDCFITDLLQKEGERMELLPHEKYLLSIDEAAEYSGIGQNRLRQIIDENPDLDFIIRRGEKKKQKLIHRKKFENWIMTLNFI